MIEVKSGVPQGSHLGPLLFVLFINDLTTVVDNSEILIFADDVKIYKRITSTHDSVLLQQDIDSFSRWCLNNELFLNVDKCCFMNFSRKLNPLSAVYCIDNVPLKNVDEFDDLGVLFDKKVTFRSHYDRMLNKANSMLGFVKRWGKEFDDPFVLKTLYESFVRSTLEYCANVWDPHYLAHTNRIEAVQKKFLRYALRKLPWYNNRDLPPYEQRLKLLGMCSLKQRRVMLNYIFIHQLLNGSIDAPEILSLISINVANRNLRTRLFLRIQYHRTNYGLFEPVSNMCRIYNNYFNLIDLNSSKAQIKRIMINL